MSVWDIYQGRIQTHGETKYKATFKRESRYIKNKIVDSLSYQDVTVFDQEHGYNITSNELQTGAYSQNLAIIDSDNLNEKYIYSIPGETIEHGSLIFWMDNYWLVEELDANNTIYCRAKMVQCNYLLKWVSDDDRICEQWCIIEDGTKYLTGEYEDRTFVVTRGDSRIAMTIARNSMTSKFSRKNRFLIDDSASDTMLAYLLTKPLKVGKTYNGKGVYKFVLQEVNTTDDDNQEFCIADFYKHFPKTTSVDIGSNPVINTNTVSESTGKKVWL